MADIFTALPLDKAWLVNRALVGIDLTDDDGNEYPDAIYTHALQAAVAALESDLSIKIADVEAFSTREDVIDYEAEGYYLQNLAFRPLRSITRFAVRFGAFPASDLPLSWCQIASETFGQLYVVPGPEWIDSYNFSAGTLVGRLGTLTPRPFQPGWFIFEGTHGFDDSTGWPADLLDAISIVASLLILDTAGDLIVGAGIASKSVSIDGLGTTINTTSSATNSGYGARVIQSRKRLDSLMLGLRRKYKRSNMDII